MVNDRLRCVERCEEDQAVLEKRISLVSNEESELIKDTRVREKSRLTIN